jgi:hypothetical protein
MSLHGSGILFAELAVEVLEDLVLTEFAFHDFISFPIP